MHACIPAIPCGSDLTSRRHMSQKRIQKSHISGPLRRGIARSPARGMSFEKCTTRCAGWGCGTRPLKPLQPKRIDDQKPRYETSLHIERNSSPNKYGNCVLTGVLAHPHPMAEIHSTTCVSDLLNVGFWKHPSQTLAACFTFLNFLLKILPVL